MSSCIFANACNEEKYITEWIYYHLNLGFNNIYIYDTSQNFSLKDTTINLDNRVTLFHKPLNGRNFNQVQTENMTEFINSHKHLHKWCALIDLDEFIVLKQHDNINTFLKEKLIDGAIGINWVFFGNNSHAKYINEPVINRFTRCSNTIDRHIKCIVNMNDVKSYNNPHYPKLIKGKQRNEKGKIYESGPWQNDSSNDYIQINHYLIKSLEEYYKRSNKHHTRENINGNLDCFLLAHNKNDILDFNAYNFLNKNYYHENLSVLDYKFYVTYYNDLLVNGIFTQSLAENHFNNDGKKENRICNLNFDFNYYKNNNDDLKNLTNVELWNHFKVHGIKENRKFQIINKI